MKMNLRFNKKLCRDLDVMEAIRDSMLRRYNTAKTPKRYICTTFVQEEIEVPWYRIISLHRDIKAWRREGYRIEIV